MTLTDLNDDVLLVIIEHIEHSKDVANLACVSQRFRILTSSNLEQREFSSIALRTTSFQDSHHPIQWIMRIMKHPSCARHIRSISINLDCPQSLNFDEPTITYVLRQLLNLSLPTNVGQQMCTALSELVIDRIPRRYWLAYKHVLDQEALRVMIRLASRLTDLELRGKSNWQIAKWMEDIDHQMQHDAWVPPCGFYTGPSRSPYVILPIVNLRLSSLDALPMSAYPGAFRLLLTKSLRYLELDELNTLGWSSSYFWPQWAASDCSIQKLVIKFHKFLPSPTILADFLSRCRAMQRFELRGSKTLLWHDDAMSFTERCDSMAYAALWSAPGLRAKGLLGYADTVRSSLGTLFAERAWVLNCFTPCSQPEHKFANCLCVAVSIDSRQPRAS